jgi:hypothetical protein
MARIGGGNDWLLAQIEAALDTIVALDQGRREYINDRDVTSEVRAAAFDQIGRYAMLIGTGTPIAHGIAPKPAAGSDRR